MREGVQMRQQWIAQWEEAGEKKSSCFISMEWEYLARIAFEIERLKDNQPIPAEYRLEKMGEPYDLRKEH
jgi:hypothetical protein